MKKRIRNKTNILNRESIKLEQNKININSMTGKRIKKSNMANNKHSPRSNEKKRRFK